MTINREDYNTEYLLFLANEAYEESKFTTVVNSTLLSESAIEMDYITEGALDALKTFIDNIIQSIADAWDKFLTNVKAFFNANDKYLNKYEKIITESKVANGVLKDFYNFDIDKINNFNIPDFDYNKISGMITDTDSANRSAFIKAYFPDFMKDDKLSFSNNVKNTLHGGDAIEMKTQDLKMKELFKYCVMYEKVTVAAINKDIDKLKAANVKAYEIINKMKSKEKEPIVKAQAESFDYSGTINYYFGEVNIEDEEEPNTNSDTTKDDTTTKDTTDNNDNKSEDKPDVNKKESPTETNSDEFKKDEKATKLYFNICSEYLAVKLSVAQEAYKTYIKIIKWHGSKYIKTSTNNAEKTDAKVEEKPAKTKATGDANSNNEKLDNAGK